MTRFRARGGGRELVGTAARSWWLALTVLILSIVLSVGGVVGVATLRAGLALKPRLVGTMTAVVRARGLESADAAAARAAELLASRRGVGQAVALDPAAGDDAVGALITGRMSPAGTTRLIAVTLKPATTVTSAEMSAELRSANLAAEVDDHRGTAGPIERSALIAGLAAVAVAAIAFIKVAFVAAFAARTGARREAERFDTLLRLGATVGWICGRLSGRIAAHVFLTASVGAILSIAGVAAAVLGDLRPELAPLVSVLRADPLNLLAVLPWPPALAAVASVAASAGAGGALKRLDAER